MRIAVVLGRFSLISFSWGSTLRANGYHYWSSHAMPLAKNVYVCMYMSEMQLGSHDSSSRTHLFIAISSAKGHPEIHIHLSLHHACIHLIVDITNLRIIVVYSQQHSQHYHFHEDGKWCKIVIHIHPSLHHAVVTQPWIMTAWKFSLNIKSWKGGMLLGSIMVNLVMTLWPTNDSIVGLLVTRRTALPQMRAVETKRNVLFSRDEERRCVT